MNVKHNKIHRTLVVIMIYTLSIRDKDYTQNKHHHLHIYNKISNYVLHCDICTTKTKISLNLNKQTMGYDKI